MDVFLYLMEYNTTDSLWGGQVSNYCFLSPEIKIDPTPEECCFSALKKQNTETKKDLLRTWFPPWT